MPCKTFESHARPFFVEQDCPTLYRCLASPANLTKCPHQVPIPLLGIPAMQAGQPGRWSRRGPGGALQPRWGLGCWARKPAETQVLDGSARSLGGGGGGRGCWGEACGNWELKAGSSSPPCSQARGLRGSGAIAVPPQTVELPSLGRQVRQADSASADAAAAAVGLTVTRATAAVL